MPTIRYEPNCLTIENVKFELPTIEKWEKIKSSILDFFDLPNYNLYLYGSFLTFLNEGENENKNLYPKDIDLHLVGPRPKDYKFMEEIFERCIKIGWDHNTQVDILYSTLPSVKDENVFRLVNSCITYATQIFWNDMPKKDLIRFSPIQRTEKLFEVSCTALIFYSLLKCFNDILTKTIHFFEVKFS